MEISEFLRRCEAEAPEHFKRVVKTTKTNGGDIKGFTKEAVNQGKMTKEQAYELQKMQAEGKLDQENKETDEKISQEMKDYIDQRVNQAIKDGTLDAPDVEQYKRLSNKWK